RPEGAGLLQGAEEVEPRLLVGELRRRRRTLQGAARLPDQQLTTPGFCQVTRKTVGSPSPLAAPEIVKLPDLRRRFPVGKGGPVHRPEGGDVVGELATASTFPTWSAPLGQTFGRGGGRVPSRFQGGKVVERKRRRGQGAAEAAPNHRARRGADDEDPLPLRVRWRTRFPNNKEVPPRTR